MLTTIRTAIILSLSLMPFVSMTALADDPVTIRIYNDDTDDIVLNVYDMNVQPHTTAESGNCKSENQRIFLDSSHLGDGRCGGERSRKMDRKKR
jgi:putative salt-induced outer membrane protein YdiY